MCWLKSQRVWLKSQRVWLKSKGFGRNPNALVKYSMDWNKSQMLTSRSQEFSSKS